jgi:regulator of replication initiation timing
MIDENQYIESLLDKLDSLNFELLKVKRANSSLKGENRHLRRLNKKLIDEAAKERKPYLRKGQKRGSRGFNG